MTGYELTKSARIAMQRRQEEHQRQQASAADQQFLQTANNGETRKRYLDGLEAKKAEKRAESERAFDQAIEPQKQQLRRQWLADHPGKSEKDFESAAWPLLRANLVDAAKQQQLDAEIAAARSKAATGMLSF